MGQAQVSGDVGIIIADGLNGPVRQQDVKDTGSTAWTARCVARKAYRYVLEQWFMLGLGVAVGLAAAVPRLGATGGYIRAEYSIKIPAIVTVFIISGLGLKTKVLLTAAADFRIHLLIQGISLGAFPGLGYAIAQGLRRAGFTGHLADGFVIMASVPTTVSTNVVYTQRAAGNEAAALVNAVVGNIIGIFITPLWLGYFLNVEGAAPYTAVLIEMTYSIIAPLLLGQILQYCMPRLVTCIKNTISMSNVSCFCIVLLVWMTFCNTFASGSTKQVPATNVAATAFLAAALFMLFCIISFLVARPPMPRGSLQKALTLSKPNSVAVVICGSMKTVALGVPLINVMYKDVPFVGLLALPLILYYMVQAMVGGLMLNPLKKWCLQVEALDCSTVTASSSSSSTCRPNMLSLLPLHNVGGCTAAESAGHTLQQAPNTVPMQQPALADAGVKGTKLVSTAWLGASHSVQEAAAVATGEAGKQTTPASVDLQPPLPAVSGVKADSSTSTAGDVTGRTHTGSTVDTSNDANELVMQQVGCLIHVDSTATRLVISVAPEPQEETTPEAEPQVIIPGIVAAAAAVSERLAVIQCSHTSGNTR